MALSGGHGTFDHPGVTHVDYKTLDMDRVLTGLLGRIWHSGLPPRLSRAQDIPVQVIVDLFVDDSAAFDGFDRDTATRWATTHLLDMIGRGRADEAVAGVRPLHGLAYRFRNSRKSRPYGADEQLYEMVAAANPAVLDELRKFFFADVDRITGTITPGPDTDVETQAVLHLVSAVHGKVEDRPNTNAPRRPYPPLCRQPAVHLAEDVMKLLYHGPYMPRTVLIEYLKVLCAFHLALYHLRIIALLPSAIAAGAIEPTCLKGHMAGEANGGIAALCPHRPQLFVDVANMPGTASAALAERSVEQWYRRIPGFVQATYTVKKLDEYADYLVRRNKINSPPLGRAYFHIPELLPLLGKKHQQERDNYFSSRLSNVMDQNDELPAEIRQIIDLGLDPFTEYIETLMHFRGRGRRRYIVDSLDSMLLKNRPGALLARPRGAHEPRRFVLDSRILEVLLQVSLLREGPDGNWRTAPMRVDEFLTLLRDRYGLYIDRLPEDGFSKVHLDDQQALRANYAAFVTRLREIGYYQDMSDAYLTQTITPRHRIGDTSAAAAAAVNR